MDNMKLVKGDLLGRVIVKTYISNLTEEEKQAYLAVIRENIDPRNLRFWENIKGLYPPPKLTPKTGELVKAMLKEKT